MKQIVELHCQLSKDGEELVATTSGLLQRSRPDGGALGRLGTGSRPISSTLTAQIAITMFEQGAHTDEVWPPWPIPCRNADTPLASPLAMLASSMAPGLSRRIRQPARILVRGAGPSTCPRTSVSSSAPVREPALSYARRFW